VNSKKTEMFGNQMGKSEINGRNTNVWINQEINPKTEMFG
jgi:hypothetical protein